MIKTGQIVSCLEMTLSVFTESITFVDAIICRPLNQKIFLTPFAHFFKNTVHGHVQAGLYRLAYQRSYLSSKLTKIWYHLTCCHRPSDHRKYVLHLMIRNKGGAAVEDLITRIGQGQEICPCGRLKMTLRWLHPPVHLATLSQSCPLSMEDLVPRFTITC